VGLGSGCWLWFEVCLGVGVGQIRRDRRFDLVGQGVTSLDRSLGRNEDRERDETVTAWLPGAEFGEVEVR
jgi:hypothetical protein